LWFRVDCPGAGAGVRFGRGSGLGSGLGRSIGFDRFFDAGCGITGGGVRVSKRVASIAA